MAGIEQVLSQMVDKLVAMNTRIEALEQLNTALGNKVLKMAGDLERCVEHVEIDRIETEKKARSKAKRAAKKAAAPVEEPAPSPEVPDVQGRVGQTGVKGIRGIVPPEGITATDIFCVEEQVGFGITDPQDIADAIGESVETVQTILAMSEDERRKVAEGA